MKLALLTLLLLAACSRLDHAEAERIAAMQAEVRTASERLQKDMTALKKRMNKYEWQAGYIWNAWLCETFTAGGCWE